MALVFSTGDKESRKAVKVTNSVIGREALREDYKRFLWLLDLMRAGPPAKLDSERFAWFITRPIQGPLTDEKPTPTGFRKLLREIAPGFDALIREGRPWEVHLFGKPSSYRLEWRGLGKEVTKDGLHVIPFFKTDWRSAFLNRAIELTAIGAHVLRPCKAEDCGKLFPASRRQEFCSGRCKQRAAQRRFRASFETDEEWRQYKHERYKGYMKRLRGGAVADHVQRRKSKGESR